MSEWETYTCESCGTGGNKVDPTTGLTMGQEYNGMILCPVCRTDKRLADGDYSNE